MNLKTNSPGNANFGMLQLISKNGENKTAPCTVGGLTGSQNRIPRRLLKQIVKSGLYMSLQSCQMIQFPGFNILSLFCTQVRTQILPQIQQSSCIHLCQCLACICMTSTKAGMSSVRKVMYFFLCHNACGSAFYHCHLLFMKNSVYVKQLGISKNERAESIRNKYICPWPFRKVIFRIKNNNILYSELKWVLQSSKTTGYNELII